MIASAWATCRATVFGDAALRDMTAKCFQFEVNVMSSERMGVLSYAEGYSLEREGDSWIFE